MTPEAKVLCLYAGGTLGMIKHNDSGYAPYPGFLTETLRTQARFHDPHADSIFSWSDTTDRFRQWTDAYSRSHPNTRPASPSPIPSPITAHAPAIPSPTAAAGHAPFSRPLQVKSSDPKGTSVRNAISKRTLEDGTLEMQLPSLITPKSSHNGQRVRYAVLEYDPLLDSSEMGLEDWTRMAKDIALNYAAFDAFVILHGTDTMSYTASAMSFLLENLGKTVIVTGAQVPLSELRNDAIENVLGALIVASSYIIPEVCLFFASTLYRGNRSSKVSNNALDAFDSPNIAPLARVGIDIDVAWNLVQRPKSNRPFRAHDSMSSKVALLRLFPGMPTDTVKTLLSSDISGLCIESFGAGNAPSRPDLLEAFRQASDRGVVIVNITQCLQGQVSAIYAVGKKLASVGVVAGGDMTTECAMTKLAYLLSKPELTRDQVRTLMGRSLRGELTDISPVHQTEADASAASSGASLSDLLGRILQRPSEVSEAQDDSLNEEAEAASRSTGMTSAQAAPQSKALQTEIADAERIILPYLIHRAAASNDVASLKWHLNALARLEEADIASSSSQTAARLQAHRGSVPTIGTAGTSDRELSSSALSSSSGRPSALPVSLSPLDSTYPLHAAAALGHATCVSLLLEAGASVHLRDYAASGHTPLYLAARNGHAAVVGLLRAVGGLLSVEEAVQVGREFGAVPGQDGAKEEEDTRALYAAFKDAEADRTSKARGTSADRKEAVRIWRQAGLELPS